LSLGGTSVTDLTPLAGTPLKRLLLGNSKVTDLTPLSECAGLEELDLQFLPVTDLTPLTKLRLTSLDCGRTKITSIAPLRGRPLRILSLYATGVTDLSPLDGCTTLEEIILPAAPGDLSLLRKLPRLKRISTRLVGGGSVASHPAQTAEEFWKEYDARPAAPK
jgi:Leucine-rich repeat (LRR) protein